MLRRRPEKLAKQIARHLLNQAAAGEAQFGDVLDSESQMATNLGVGRASVREALRLLEMIGLVTIRQGAGGGPALRRPEPADFAEILTMFFQIEAATVGDLVEATAALQGAAAYRATQRCAAGEVSDEEIARLRASVVKLPGPSSREFLATGSSFHRAVWTLCGNRILQLLCESGSTLLGERVLRPPFTLYGRVDSDKVTHDHHEIAEAILAGDPAVAMALMFDHQVEAVRSACEGYEIVLTQVLDWRPQETIAGGGY